MNNQTPNQSDENGTAISSLTNRQRRGFVARLPKSFRDKINQMLDDGHAYAAIVAELQSSTNPLPHPISDDHIKTWNRRLPGLPSQSRLR